MCVNKKELKENHEEYLQIKGFTIDKNNDAIRLIDKMINDINNQSKEEFLLEII